MASRAWNWKRMENTSGPWPKPRHGHRAVAFKDQMIIYGGGSDGIQTSLSVFSTVTRNWYSPTVKGDAPPGLASFGFVAFGPRILLFGGVMASHVCTNDLYELNVLSWEWKKISYKTGSGCQLPCPRLGHSFNAWENKAVLFGGLTLFPSSAPEVTPHRYLNDLYFMDLWPLSEVGGPTPVWEWPSCSGEVPTPRESHAATVCRVGSVSTLIIHGGCDGARLDDLHMLNLELLQWYRPTTSGIPPLPRSLHTINVLHNRLILFGGWIDSGSKSRSKESSQKKVPCECTNCLACLNLTNLTWESFFTTAETKAITPRPRSGHSSVIIGKRLFLFSGRIGCKWTCSCPSLAKDVWYLETERPQQTAAVMLNCSHIRSLEISWTPVWNAEAYIVQLQKYNIPALECPTTTDAPAAERGTGCSGISTAGNSTAVAAPASRAGTVLNDVAATTAGACIGPAKETVAARSPNVGEGPLTGISASAAKPSNQLVRAVLAGNTSSSTSPTMQTLGLVRLMNPVSAAATATPTLVRLATPIGATAGKGMISMSNVARGAGFQLLSQQQQQQQIITLVRAPVSGLVPAGCTMIATRAPSSTCSKDAAPAAPSIVAVSGKQPTIGKQLAIASSGAPATVASAPQGLFLSTVAPGPVVASRGSFVLAGSPALAASQAGILLSPMGNPAIVATTACQPLILTSSSTSSGSPAQQSGLMAVVQQPVPGLPRVTAVTAGMRQLLLVNPPSMSPTSHVTQPLHQLVPVSAGAIVATVSSPGRAASVTAVTQPAPSTGDGHTEGPAYRTKLQYKPDDGIGGGSHSIVRACADNKKGSTIVEVQPHATPSPAGSDDPHGGTCEASRLDSNLWSLVDTVKDAKIHITSYFLATETRCNEDSFVDVDAADDSGIGLETVPLEAYTAYKIRIAGINSLGRGRWSNVVAHRTAPMGVPRPPTAIRIAKTADGGQISWEPPTNNDGSNCTITEYCVYMAVKQSGVPLQRPRPGAPQPQYAFVRVYCGPSPHCTILNTTLQSAHLEVQSNQKQFFIFRIAAQNSQGYGPVAHVRWLVKPEVLATIRVASAASKTKKLPLPALSTGSSTSAPPTQSVLASSVSFAVPVSSASFAVIPVPGTTAQLYVPTTAAGGSSTAASTVVGPVAAVAHMPASTRLVQGNVGSVSGTEDAGSSPKPKRQKLDHS